MGVPGGRNTGIHQQVHAGDPYSGRSRHIDRMLGIRGRSSRHGILWTADTEAEHLPDCHLPAVLHRSAGNGLVMDYCGNHWNRTYRSCYGTWNQQCHGSWRHHYRRLFWRQNVTFVGYDKSGSGNGRFDFVRSYKTYDMDRNTVAADRAGGLHYTGTEGQ